MTNKWHTCTATVDWNAKRGTYSTMIYINAMVNFKPSEHYENYVSISMHSQSEVICSNLFAFVSSPNICRGQKATESGKSLNFYTIIFKTIGQK